MIDLQDNTIVTIDGPAGAGKSTMARQLAAKLGWLYLDTGAMYRAITWKALQAHVDCRDEQALVDLAKRTQITLAQSHSAENISSQLQLDGKPLGGEIRSQIVTDQVSVVAAHRGVRDVMLVWQRQFGAQRSLVAEGRDAGSVIFPNAQFKFYLDADLNERARRRNNEYQAKGVASREDDQQKFLAQRDHLDSTRTIAPLTIPQDAIRIDSTHLSIVNVLKVMMDYIERAR